MSHAPSPASAQPTGGLSGLIYDQTGAPLPGVRITIEGSPTAAPKPAPRASLRFRTCRKAPTTCPWNGAGSRRAPGRARAGGGTGHSFPDLTRRPRGGNDCHGREGRRARRQSMPIAISAVSEADFGRLGAQTIEGAPSLAPSVTFRRTPAGASSRFVGSGQTRCLPDRIRVRPSISTASTSLDQPWRSRGFSISSASRASRAAGHVVWAQRCRRGDEPHFPAAHQ